MPLAASQTPGKYLCFLVTRTKEKQHMDPEDFVLSPTRLGDFPVKRGVKELSLPLMAQTKDECILGSCTRWCM